jgi:four helix bundle protein
MKDELQVVRDSRELFFIIHKIAMLNPSFRWSLNQQIIRATISIGSNVVEGRRKSHLTFLNQIDNAIGSAEEVLYQLSLYTEPKEELEIAFQKTDFIIGKLINLKKAVKAQGSGHLAQGGVV